MKICFISNPNTAHTRRWVNWFSQRGHHVCLIIDAPLEYPWPGVKIIDLPARFNQSGLRFLPWAWWTRQFIQAWQPDIVHAHRVNSAGWLGTFSDFHPFVVTPWGSDLYLFPHRSPLHHWLTNWVLTHADLVTTDSADLRQEAIRYGANPTRTQLIQWGVDLSLFIPGASSDALRQQYQLPTGPILLSLRAVKPTYSLETLIDAMPIILSKAPQATLLLRDYNTVPAYKAALDQRIQKLHLQAHIRWIPQVEPWEKVVEIYQVADLALSTPLSDGTPVAVLEAMACGLPVVVSDLPSLREWINDGQNGFLVPCQDAPALAQAVLKLTESPALCERFRQRNLELVRTRANHQVEMEKMEVLYLQLLTT